MHGNATHRTAALNIRGAGVAPAANLRDARIEMFMRRLFVLTLPIVLAACAATGAGGPVLPGLVNAPPPPIGCGGFAADRRRLVMARHADERRRRRRARRDASAIRVEFRAGGTVNVRADCNRGSATYTRNGNALGIGPIALTRMACPSDTRDADFVKGLAAVSRTFDAWQRSRADVEGGRRLDAIHVVAPMKRTTGTPQRGVPVSRLFGRLRERQCAVCECSPPGSEISEIV